jgi:hypothetical protein
MTLLCQVRVGITEGLISWQHAMRSSLVLALCSGGYYNTLLPALRDLILALRRNPYKNGNPMNKLHELLNSERLTETALAEGGGVLLDLEGQQILSLNGVGLEIVQMLRREAISQTDLASHIAKIYGIDEDTAAGDVALFIERLSQFLKL